MFLWLLPLLRGDTTRFPDFCHYCCGVLPRDFHGFCRCCGVLPRYFHSVPLERHASRVPSPVCWSSFFFAFAHFIWYWIMVPLLPLLGTPPTPHLDSTWCRSLRSKIESMEASVKAILTEEKVRGHLQYVFESSSCVNSSFIVFHLPPTGRR